MLPDELSEVLARYAATQPRRARGGLNAIAGISFQFECYIAVE